MRFSILLAGLTLGLSACSGGEKPPANPSTGAPSAPTTQAPAAGVVNVYSSRHYDSDKAMFDAFEKSSGIKVRLREAGASQLLETMKVEGERSPADLVITSDAGSLYRFQSAGLLQPVRDEALEAAIPAHFRDPEGYWYGLAKRARVIVYDPDRLSAEQVDDYTDLAAPALKSEVCQRSSSNIYNLSLMGELIERHGADTAQDVASAIADNFARPPSGGDTAQIQSIAAGECSAAFINHYYWVRLSQSGSRADRAAAGKTKLSFPDQASGGTHVNVTGAGISSTAPNKENAIKLLEFLASPEGQSMLITETKEFPIIPGVPAPEGTDTLPVFTESTLPLDTLGKNQTAAQQIFDKAGWN